MCTFQRVCRLDVLMAAHTAVDCVCLYAVRDRAQLLCGCAALRPSFVAQRCCWCERDAANGLDGARVAGLEGHSSCCLSAVQMQLSTTAGDWCCVQTVEGGNRVYQRSAWRCLHHDPAPHSQLLQTKPKAHMYHETPGRAQVGCCELAGSDLAHVQCFGLLWCCDQVLGTAGEKRLIINCVERSRKQKQFVGESDRCGLTAQQLCPNRLSKRCVSLQIV